MDSARFDALTRALSSRRTAVGALLGGLAALVGLAGPDPATAHDPGPACRLLTDPEQRQRCLRRARAHRRRCHTDPPAVACRGRCGRWPNRCGRLVSCPACAAPKVCRSNGSCLRVCLGNPDCPAGCFCWMPGVVEGGRACAPTMLTCAQFPRACSATRSCPAGSACMVTACAPDGGLVNRCVPLCQA